MPASVTTIASFPTSTGDGTEPDGQLFIDSSGNLIGATVLGGADGVGTTYEIVKTGGGFTTTPTFLADIPESLNTLVGVPNLSADANGDLFGLIFSGGANSLGAVVEFPKAGGSATLMTTFTGGAGGSHPGGTLLVDASGNLFGTTLSGGTNNAGTVFEIQKTGGSYPTTPTPPITLTSFGAGITPSGLGNLVEDAAGDLFGTTTSSVFEVKKTGSSYGAPVSLVPFPVGTQIGTLTIDAKGDIFGTTISGGENDDGTVFEIEKTATGYASTPTTLASFTPADGQLSLNRPKTLIVDASGDLFGTTDPSTQPGGNTGGVVFEIIRTSTGYESVPTIVANFNGLGDGSLGANVVADANGNLFGTTQAGGGANSKGSAFEITDSGFATTPKVVPIISDILMQNTSSGQVSVWEMDGNTIIGGGPVANPGPSWQAVGIGDFNKDGNSDTLMQNTSSGQVSVWEMNGNTIIGGGPVADPGPSWKAIGTGDFNKDGNSDILMQNTSNGQVSVWEMNGNTIIGGGPVADPGSSWKAIGTGDFNKDGNSDILMQNTSSGQVSVWEMNGNTIIGGGPVADPGPSWKAIGTGDFNKDGNSDILMQNTSSGQVSIWEMSGDTIIGGGPVADPGPSWHAIGTGAGGSDILMQNTSSGQVSLWEMNGATIGGGGPVANPGPTWHGIAMT
jgi:FG-GAP-like repeat